MANGIGDGLANGIERILPALLALQILNLRRHANVALYKGHGFLDLINGRPLYHFHVRGNEPCRHP